MSKSNMTTPSHTAMEGMAFGQLAHQLRITWGSCVAFFHPFGVRGFLSLPQGKT